MPSSTLELRAEPRSVLGKHVRRLRRQGLVPANIYGHGASRAIQAPARVLEHLLVHGGRTGLISIALDGASETTLLKTIQRDPRSGQILHIDFQAVSMDETVTSTVPLRFVGESFAAQRLGGIMTHPKTEVRIEARASDLPDAIEVDVTALTELHSAIHVSDLAAATTYRVLDPPEEVLAIVLPPAVEAEVEAAAPEEAAAAPAAEAGEQPAGSTEGSA
jgi:large subunit ribosomal protein L25